MTKHLIINADDYARSNLTVDGIVECAKAGAITSTTIMATGHAFEYGIRRLPDLGSISIGVHLDAVEGMPCSEASETPTIIDKTTGQFKDLRDRRNLRDVDPSDLKTEFRRQIEKVKKTGIRISHLDNHYPWIYYSSLYFGVVADLAAENRVRIRYPFANISDARIVCLSNRFKISEADVRSTKKNCDAILRNQAIRHTDYFWFEFSSIKRTQDGLNEIIENLPEGTSEILTHPGEDTDHHRQELIILLHTAKQGLLKQHGIKLVNFWEV